MALSSEWGGGFLEGFLEEETLPLSPDGREPGKGRSGQFHWG